LKNPRGIVGFGATILEVGTEMEKENKRGKKGGNIWGCTDENKKGRKRRIMRKAG